MARDGTTTTRDAVAEGSFDFGPRTAHVVEFYLGSERCAIDIDAVDSIVEMKEVTRVPRAPEAVEGVMDLRGVTTAVVDPTEFLSVDGADEEQDLVAADEEQNPGTAADQNILVLDRESDKQKIGIKVDEVTEVGTYGESRVDESGDLSGIESNALEADLLEGVIRKPIGELDEDGNPEELALVLWLDIETLVERAAGRGSRSADGR